MSGGDRQQWRLIVFDGRGFDRVLHRMGLRPSRSSAHQYIGYYALAAEPQLRRHIASLKTANLHGIAKKIPRRPVAQSTAQQKPKRRSGARPRRPDAEVVSILIAQENRLARDALKRARERRRQAEFLAEREAAERAHKAVRRLKGEV